MVNFTPINLSADKVAQCNLIFNNIDLSNISYVPCLHLRTEFELIFYFFIAYIISRIIRGIVFKYFKKDKFIMVIPKTKFTEKETINLIDYIVFFLRLVLDLKILLLGLDLFLGLRLSI